MKALHLLANALQLGAFRGERTHSYQLPASPLAPGSAGTVPPCEGHVSRAVELLLPFLCLLSAYSSDTQIIAVAVEP